MVDNHSDYFASQKRVKQIFEYPICGVFKVINATTTKSWIVFQKLIETLQKKKKPILTRDLAFSFLNNFNLYSSNFI
jgi:hypothetical protein